MISPSDFFPLEYTQDLTHAGVSLTCRSLIRTHIKDINPTLPNIRNQVAGSTLALAFRRLINQENIPHRYLETPPFTAPEHRDIAIGGRRCTLIHALITPRKWIQQITKNSNDLLKAKAITTNKQRTTRYYNDDDLYIFGFLLGLVTPNMRTIQKAQAAKQPVYLIYKLSPQWQAPKNWQSLGELVVENDSINEVNLEVCGSNAQRGYLSKTIQLSPGESQPVSSEFYTVSHLHIDSLPNGNIRLYSPGMDESCFIRPVEWGNIWIYGIKIMIVGYLTCGAFWERATPITIHEQFFRPHLEHIKPYGVPVSELNPLSGLFLQAKNWRAQKNNLHSVPTHAIIHLRSRLFIGFPL